MNLVSMLLAQAAIAGTGQSVPDPAPQLSRTKVQILSPWDSPDVPTDKSSADIEGIRIHKRVISKPLGGPPTLDISFNVYVPPIKLGVLAYYNDEVCYVSAGLIAVRPAYRPNVPTDIGEGKPLVSVCAFSPAREAGWGHIIPKDKVGIWPNPDKPPLPLTVFPYQKAPAHDLAGIEGPPARVYEAVNRGTGSETMDVRVFEIPKGFRMGPIRHLTDEVCWLETGGLTVSLGAERLPVTSYSFIFRPAGTATDGLEATSASRLICFTIQAKS